MKEKTRSKRRLRPWVKAVLFIMAFVMVMAISVTGYAYYKISKASNKAQVSLERGDTSQKRVKAFDPGKDSFSVLLLGIDSRPGETVDEARSDAVLLAAVNRTEKTIKLLSIPRDSYVDIPGRGYDKIAHAHAFGSADLSVKTVENLLNIPVDYVISGNFKAFQDIVDELNGIDVTIEDEGIAKQMEKDSKGKVHVQTGTHTLNGEEALAFVRTRKADSDLMRGKRQMEALQAIFEKSKSISSIPSYDNIIDTLGDNVSTNLSMKQFIGLFPLLSSLKSVDTIQLKGHDYQPGNVYYFELDGAGLEEVRTELREQLELS
ncbi:MULTISPECIES: LCP family protein [unclassified Bacillus (in: firmicutes)]|uniref:LCP family protein n=1 Tax=unclassified Bacillus (in: firmicutes) TaxID=185979 RepID=UPI000D0431CB|nr:MULTISPECIES: LCP family protein [unclassified Bacillus (in: firmicutes)]PRR91978.1 LytR family transcriptional regulator [Bacillus sp. NMCN1]PRR99609.1 LytR family transcriptional regulator [Bacillus sp. NMCN6]